MPALCVSVRKRWPFLLAAPRHMAKKKSFRSGPRIVSDHDRCTLLIRGCRHMLLPVRRRCFRCREKTKTGSSLARALRSPSCSTTSGQRLPDPHEYAKSPVAESRMLSASSDQSCCHFPSLQVGEGCSESRPLILLMGKKPAKHFKEKCFTF